MAVLRRYNAGFMGAVKSYLTDGVAPTPSTTEGGGVSYCSAGLKFGKREGSEGGEAPVIWGFLVYSELC